MTTARCYATVLLDDETRRSLAALIGPHEAAWVHGCALEHGHEGDHASKADRAGSLNYWIQWEDGGRPRISTAGPPHPAGSPHPAGPPHSAGPRPGSTDDRAHQRHRLTPTARAAPAATSSESGPAQPESATSGQASQTEALWAIAAALERLADICKALLQADDGGGRHGTGRGG